MTVPGADADFLWRIEEACTNAWPSTRQLVIDGWLLRASGGDTRRLNSASLLRAGATSGAGGGLDASIAACEAAYEALNRDSLFRVTDLASHVDSILAGRGYAAEGETCTLLACLSTPLPTGSGAAHILDAGDPAWADARIRLTGGDPPANALLAATLGAVSLPSARAMVSDAHGIVAVGFGAIDRDILVVEAVVTSAAHRRRGHARSVVAALIGWAQDRGARWACLQVSADNDGARGLYAQLGFTTELYRYHYRHRALIPARRPA